MLTRVRDLISEPLTIDYFQKRQKDGWIVAAVEWVKDAGSTAEEKSELRSSSAAHPQFEELPYGYRIAEDCSHLMRDEREMEIIETLFEKVVAGWRPTEIAEELNGRGFKTRQQRPWTPGSVFDLLPRLIEMSPKLLKRPDWPSRRKTLEIIA